jgi:shikimate dehydrogenase
VFEIDNEVTLVGHNTDAQGFYNSLTPKAKTLKEADALILGMGGSALAVLSALRFEMPHALRTITLVSRDLKRQKAISEQWREWANESPCATILAFTTFDQLEETTLATTKLLINTTPVGMSPNINESPLSELQMGMLNKKSHLVDLVYNPEETLLIKYARKAGILHTHNGLDMLIHQAILSFSCWTKLEPQPHWFTQVKQRLEASINS